MIIFEWHMRKLQVIQEQGPSKSLLKLKVKKKEVKTFPIVVKLAIWNIMNY